MSINNLVIGLMVAYFVCSYLIACKFARLVFSSNKGYGFKIKWHDKAASSYVLALPVFTLITWLTTL